MYGPSHLLEIFDSRPGSTVSVLLSPGQDVGVRYTRPSPGLEVFSYVGPSLELTMEHSVTCLVGRFGTDLRTGCL